MSFKACFIPVILYPYLCVCKQQLLRHFWLHIAHTNGPHTEEYALSHIPMDRVTDHWITRRQHLVYYTALYIWNILYKFYLRSPPFFCWIISTFLEIHSIFNLFYFLILCDTKRSRANFSVTEVLNFCKIFGVNVWRLSDVSAPNLKNSPDWSARGGSLYVLYFSTFRFFTVPETLITPNSVVGSIFEKVQSPVKFSSMQYSMLS